MAQRAAQAVQAPHHDRVAGSELVEQGVERRAVLEPAAGLVREDPGAADSGQCVVLQGLVLLEGRDSGLAQPIAGP